MKYVPSQIMIRTPTAPVVVIGGGRWGRLSRSHENRLLPIVHLPMHVDAHGSGSGDRVTVSGAKPPPLHGLFVPADLHLPFALDGPIGEMAITRRVAEH
jgi:hypothetical protein